MPLTASTVTRTVSVDGASVTCHDSVTPGELDRPLVLVHGTGGTTASHFGHLFPMMATRTRVFAVDWAPPADPAAAVAAFWQWWAVSYTHLTLPTILRV